MKNLIIICVPLILLMSCYNERLEVSNELRIDSLEVLTDSTGHLSALEVLKAENSFKKVPQGLPNFGDTPFNHWIKLELTNISEDTTFSFITRGIDSLFFYEVMSSNIMRETLSGSHITDKYRNVKDSYISVPFNISSKKEKTLLIRPSNSNYKLSLDPFKVLNAKDSEYFFTNRQLIKSLYIGGMVILFLFGVILFILFKSKLYFYYSLCVILTLSMMLSNFDYPYIFFGYIPQVIANKNIYGFYTSILPLCYLFFATEFLKVPEWVSKRFKPIVQVLTFLTFTLLSIFLIFDISIFKYRRIFEILVFALCSAPLVLLYYSFKIKYKPSWIFLFATMPVLVTGILESLGEWHMIPVQQMHNMYYTSTFFELFFLTIGLSFKFKTLQEEKRKYELDIIDKEIAAKERERREIGKAMHDNVGGLLTAAKLKFDSIRDKLESSKDNEALEKGLQILDESANTIREFSHKLRPSSFLSLGLTEGLKELYSESSHPTIKIQEYGYNTRLPIDLEDELFSIIQEGVSNAVKHACASEITVSISVFEKDLQVIIEDDGIGFSANKTSSGMGLQNLKYRVGKRLRGTFAIDSLKGNGTTLMITIPR